MKLYADNSARFTAQLVADVLFVCWVIAWVWIGNVVHDGTLELAGPGHQITSSATGLADSMKGAGDALGDLPVIGDGAAAPFDQASRPPRSLADAGRTEVHAVEQLAFWLGLSIALIPILHRRRCATCPAGSGSSATRPPRSGSWTVPPTSSSSRCGRSRTSRCTCWPGSATTR